MQSVALGKGKILLEGWQTHFIRDLLTSSKTRTLHQVSLKHQMTLSFVEIPHPHSICWFTPCVVHHINGNKIATK